MSRAKPPADCPICRAAVAPEVEAYPFCSERCRTIDLGNWLGESYRVDAGPGGSDPVPDSDD